MEPRFVDLIGADAALNWQKVTQALDDLQTQSRPVIEVRSPCANFVKENRAGDQAGLSLLDRSIAKILPPAAAMLAAATWLDSATATALAHLAQRQAIETQAIDTPESITDIAQMLEAATTPEEVQAMRTLSGMTQAVWQAVGDRLKSTNLEQFERVEQWSRQLKRSGQFAIGSA